MSVMQRKNGFTMIEILLVVIMISILAAMVVPNLTGRTDQAKLVAVATDIETNLPAVLDLYKMDNGIFPTTEQGLGALLKKPTSTPAAEHWNGPYIKKRKLPQDPWGRAYNYVAPGVHNKDGFDLSSFGPDGVEGKDDIMNWEKEK